MMGCRPRRLRVGSGYCGCEGKEEGSLSLIRIGGHFARDGWVVSQIMGSTRLAGRGYGGSGNAGARDRMRGAVGQLGCKSVDGWKVIEA